ncbi:hypothetical protein Pelo_13867 [Pelomyxa schiedti]|nr:hypothetical protein Pelo_13867 [Pelomyxa schiedti]
MSTSRGGSWIDRILALAAARHHRVGERSPARFLSEHLLRELAPRLVPLPIFVGVGEERVICWDLNSFVCMPPKMLRFPGVLVGANNTAALVWESHSNAIIEVNPLTDVMPIKCTGVYDNNWPLKAHGSYWARSESGQIVVSVLSTYPVRHSVTTLTCPPLYQIKTLQWLTNRVIMTSDTGGAVFFWDIESNKTLIRTLQLPQSAESPTWCTTCSCSTFCVACITVQGGLFIFKAPIPSSTTDEFVTIQTDYCDARSVSVCLNIVLVGRDKGTVDIIKVMQSTNTYNLVGSFTMPYSTSSSATDTGVPPPVTWVEFTPPFYVICRSSLGLAVYNMRSGDWGFIPTPTLIPIPPGTGSRTETLIHTESALIQTDEPLLKSRQIEEFRMEQMLLSGRQPPETETRLIADESEDDDEQSYPLLHPTKPLCLVM